MNCAGAIIVGETHCISCGCSLFTPWLGEYGNSSDVLLTRCQSCGAPVPVDGAACFDCNDANMAWELWHDLFDGEQPVSSEDALMNLCCGLRYDECCCRMPIPQGLLDLLIIGDRPHDAMATTPQLYAADGKCYACINQFTTNCKPLVQQLQMARHRIIEDSGQPWLSVWLTGCQDFVAHDELSDETDDEIDAIVAQHIES